jgi:hypothetical protein
MTPPTEVIEAAKAVIARWDSKDWKAPPTAEVMNGLRNALAELSRREDRFVFVADLPVAFAKLQRAGEVTLFFTESEYNALRDLLLAITNGGNATTGGENDK